MDVCELKKKIRKEIIETRNNININAREKLDIAILNKFYESSYYNKAEKIFVYLGFGSEINTRSLINEAFKDNKKIFIPKTDYKIKKMEAVEIHSLDNLKEEKYGILEPKTYEGVIDPNELDLIVVPGVAFDKNCMRLGYGAGYYDRFFKRILNTNINKIALVYDFQILDSVPIDKYDMPVDSVFSESREILTV